MGNSTSGLTITISIPNEKDVTMIKLDYPLDKSNEESKKKILMLRKMLQAPGEKVIQSITMSLNTPTSVFEPCEESLVQLIDISKEPIPVSKGEEKAGYLTRALDCVNEMARKKPTDDDVIQGSIVIETLVIDLRFGTQLKGLCNMRESDAARMFAVHLVLLFSTYNAKCKTIKFTTNTMPEKHQTIINTIISSYIQT
jgi:hypothetical protein